MHRKKILAALLSLALVSSPLLAPVSAAEGQIPYTSSQAEDLQCGKLALEDRHVDSLLFGQDLLDPEGDADGDGIPDGEDSQPLKWNVSDRDMVLFMELCYRELAPYWKLKKTYSNGNGYFAALFETRNDFPFLKEAPKVHVLAIQGTNDAADARSDIALFAGANPEQAGNAEACADELGQNPEVKEFYITGHSLGGYLSQRAALQTVKKGYTNFV